jgi:hypothetical protein
VHEERKRGQEVAGLRDRAAGLEGHHVVDEMTLSAEALYNSSSLPEKGNNPLALMTSCGIVVTMCHLAESGHVASLDSDIVRVLFILTLTRGAP